MVRIRLEKFGSGRKSVNSDRKPCLARRLVQVEDGDDEGAERALGDGQGHAEEGVEGVGLAGAGGARQARPELRLKKKENGAITPMLWINYFFGSGFYLPGHF